MKNSFNPKILITTSIDSNLPKNGSHIIFLGNWCLKYKFKEKYSNYNYSILPYHWDDREKLYKDYLLIQLIYESILDSLSEKLNYYHCVNRKKSYWRILVGPWLGYFIQVLFDRWFMLNKALKEYKFAYIYINEFSKPDLVPNTMDEFKDYVVTDEWNEMIYLSILEFLNLENLKILNSKKFRFNNKAKSSNQIFKGTFKIVRNFLSQNLGRSNKVFIKESYLSLSDFLKLSFSINQFPSYWESSALIDKKYNPKYRDFKLNINFEEAGLESFIKLLEVLIPKNIPKIYLEGYEDLIESNRNVKWPKNPKVIFTSVGFLFDDFFKAWIASKIDNGTKLVTGQHGGNYGILKWFFFEDHQYKISDYFLTWGWDKKDKNKLVKIGLFKFLPKLKTNNLIIKEKQKILLVLASFPRFSYHMYSSLVSQVQMERYLNDQFNFVECIPKKLRNNLCVRLDSIDLGNDFYNRWIDKFDNLNIDSGKTPISNILKSTKVYIATYCATTYIESLALNIPTIIFWDENYWEINDESKKYFELLKKANIFFDNPMDAANHLVINWDSINDWWENPKTQKARLEFLSKFGNYDKNSFSNLRSFFYKFIK